MRRLRDQVNQIHPHPDLLGFRDVVHFPYAVLEIKLEDEEACPQWLHVSGNMVNYQYLMVIPS
jgi:SPX domain protein involved in polyphosphate accumulation